MKIVYDIEQFKDRITKCAGIICIGIGNRWETMLNKFECIGIKEKIIMLADNNIVRYGEPVKIGTKELKIESVDDITKAYNKDIMIIVCCAKHNEIVEQLSNYSFYDEAEIVCFSHIFVQFADEAAMKKELPENLQLSDIQQIPKVIHYCWFGNNPIPEKYKEWIKSWKKYCPEYEIVEWNEANYDITKNKYMHQAYLSKKWGFVPDYARLDIIYNHGGIYLDTDVELIKNLDHLLYQKGFAGFENDNAVAFGLGFGAVKGLPIIKELRDFYNEIEFIDSNGKLNLTPSPKFQTDILRAHGLELNGEYQKVADMTIYPQKMFCPKSFASRLTIPKPYTCSIHHFDASWLDQESRNQLLDFEKEMNERFANAT